MNGSKGKGFQLFNKPALEEPSSKPLWGSGGSSSKSKPAGLSAVTPLTNFAAGGAGGQPKTYGKKIGFNDDSFDDDWDESSRKQELAG